MPALPSEQTLIYKAITDMPGHPSHPAKPSSQTGIGSYLVIWGFAALLLISSWSAIVYKIDNERQVELAQVFRNNANLARVFEEHTIRTIESVDQAIRFLRNQYERVGDKIDIAGYVKDGLIDDHIFTQLGIVDEKGIYRHGSIASGIGTDVSEREHIRVHVPADSEALFVGKSITGKVTRKWSMTFTRRINRRDGSFGGVVAVSLDPQYLTGFYRQIDLGRYGIVALVGADSAIRARRQGDEVSYGQDLTGSAVMKAAFEQVNGTTVNVARIDGVKRLYSFRKVKDYPLWVFVASAEEEALAGTHARAHLYQWFGGVLSLLILGFTLAITRDIRRRRQTEVELSHVSHYSRSLIEASLDPLVTISPTGKITDVNHATEAVTGCSRTELIGSDFSDYFTDPASARAGYRTVFSEGKVKDYPLSIRHAAGSVTEVLYNATIYRDEAGNVEGVFAAARDVTALKAAERELAAYRQHLEDLVAQRTAELVQTETKATFILESSADGLYGVDEKGFVTFINPAGCELLGYRADEVIGKSAHALLHHSKPDGQPYPEAECHAHRALEAGEARRIDNEVYWRADGKSLPVMYAIHPIVQEGRVAGAVTSFVDMSEQRAAAEARERALLAAENLARVRREFLANMSHELRTPLNGVLGFAEIGLRHYRNADKARDAFEKIRLTGTRLLGVIHDVLDFSRIEAGKLNIELVPVSLHEIIDQSVEVVREKANAKHLELKIERAPELPTTCISDPLRLGQVLLNLLSNAVKFTETGGVTLAASLAEGMLVFVVRDTGIGMRREQLDLLFNPFQQADSSSTRRFGGTGLGLVISKRIVELMGGDIAVESQAGTGSTFRFRLPCIAPPAQTETSGDRAATPAALPPKPLAGIAVLVAEDEPINQAVITENLAEDGANVTLAGNGKEAVDWIVRDGKRYDIVLMDIQMPVMDGFEATRQILHHLPDQPIIGQTAHALKEERDKCLDSGMVAHISKPIDSDALTRLILKYARGSRQ